MVPNACLSFQEKLSRRVSYFIALFAKAPLTFRRFRNLMVSDVAFVNWDKNWDGFCILKDVSRFSEGKFGLSD